MKKINRRWFLKSDIAISSTKQFFSDFPQDYTNKILIQKLNVFMIIYQDHILIYTKDVD